MARRTTNSILLAAGLLSLTAATGFAVDKKAPAPKPSAAAAQSAAEQPAPAALPPVGTEPGLTTATYGDWVLRCQRVGEGEGTKQCEVAQTLQLQGQQTTIAQIAFGKIGTPEAMVLTVAVPSNITLPSSASFGVGDKDPHPVELTWRRCLPAACIAEGAPADAMKGFLAAKDPGRLVFKDASGRDIALPISFRGLAQAVEALNKA